MRVNILAEYNQGTFVEPNNMTVKELLERWLEDYVKIYVAENTAGWYGTIAKKHLIPALGSVRLRDLNPADVQRYYRYALESGRLDSKGRVTGKPLSALTVRYHHAVLRMALSQGVKWGLIPRNVTDLVDPPKVRQSEIEFWRPEESRRFLEVAKGHRNYAFYATALGTGMRPGEVAGLKWSDVDFDAKRITVRRTLTKPGPAPKFGPPKTKAGRRAIALSPSLVSLLRRHKAIQNRERLSLGEEFEDHDLVFTQPNGRSLHTNNMQKREFTELIKEAGLPRITLHGLRHTHATELLMRGVHPKVVQERLGHARISITLDTYSHVIPNMQHDAAELIDDLLTGQEGTEKD